MAERIMMTPQELNDGAVFLRERMEAMNEEVASLRNRIEDVASRWEGAAQESFIEQFMGDMYPILSETLPQIIEGLASELDAAANAIRETDESLASAFRG
ncbi:WXG100 family type VII secretion target [Acetatifactor muris]|uniref:ESAT-6-like protein n=1 Tax=Acetatifactor muris TaxID=879566 RepID=A0A2K4ZEC7_9FIRM|nr:WXG100 family type VII secretion target [Acetatifactor muris]MCR2047199.1 WXG100 family type VII secretion target [Acetatifactor muris]SOY28811.1 Proteins of 100 residues with WXG [Acetatifactor muris]